MSIQELVDRDPTYAPIISKRHQNLYLSTCGGCRQGVFKYQQWVFARRPLGICHVECAEVVPDTPAPPAAFAPSAVPQRQRARTNKQTPIASAPAIRRRSGVAVTGRADGPRTAGKADATEMHQPPPRTGGPAGPTIRPDKTEYLHALQVERHGSPDDLEAERWHAERQVRDEYPFHANG